MTDKLRQTVLRAVYDPAALRDLITLREGQIATRSSMPAVPVRSDAGTAFLPDHGPEERR